MRTTLSYGWTNLPVRAAEALMNRGPRYVWHKAMRRALGRWPGLKRSMVYADPRAYWTLRGGEDYYREQEDQPARTARAHWLADRIARYRPVSVLEVGCGYGKQLNLLRDRLGASAWLVGVDFSPSQLAQARRHLGSVGGVDLVLASGAELPFPDGTFDLVLTSAVILHNPPSIAERMRHEVLRVTRRFAAHNEDTNISYNRYGYDTAAWYATKGIPLVEAGSIPLDPSEDPLAPWSQFCVADLRAGSTAP